MKEQQEETQTQNDESQDYFSRLMFGDRLERKREQKSHYTDKDYREENDSYLKEQQNILRTLENVDYLQLMENIDTLMDSAKKLKPFIQQIQPIMKSFLKK